MSQENPNFAEKSANFVIGAGIIGVALGFFGVEGVLVPAIGLIALGASGKALAS